MTTPPGLAHLRSQTHSNLTAPLMLCWEAVAGFTDRSLRAVKGPFTDSESVKGPFTDSRQARSGQPATSRAARMMLSVSIPWWW
ncbi:hypothetical protein ATK36_6149 [Amycolatopsis sulphurea]|uniref:Uncharacterized protein n=1 Tax=Amycolatopsis sulphurea TaxID=76022 RepID=A0A2A9FK52_9PSEU|nr:hypothetical protein ATK36_6149 [Amycolatopsis sulphurea]